MMAAGQPFETTCYSVPMPKCRNKPTARPRRAVSRALREGPRMPRCRVPRMQKRTHHRSIDETPDSHSEFTVFTKRSQIIARNEGVYFRRSLKCGTVVASIERLNRKNKPITRHRRVMVLRLGEEPRIAGHGVPKMQKQTHHESRSRS